MLCEILEVGRRNAEHFHDIINLVVFAELVENGIATRQDVVKHDLHSVLIEVLEVDVAQTDLVDKVPMQEGKGQVRVLQLSRVH